MFEIAHDIAYDQDPLVLLSKEVLYPGSAGQCLKSKEILKPMSYVLLSVHGQLAKRKCV